MIQISTSQVRLRKRHYTNMGLGMISMLRTDQNWILLRSIMYNGIRLLHYFRVLQNICIFRTRLRKYNIIIQRTKN